LMITWVYKMKITSFTVALTGVPAAPCIVVFSKI
jgi:hypothetical protein